MVPFPYPCEDICEKIEAVLGHAYLLDGVVSRCAGAEATHKQQFT